MKGVTHCLLPECNNPVWPFMNYCGRTHADLGKQRGLQRKRYCFMMDMILLLAEQLQYHKMTSLPNHLTAA